MGVKRERAHGCVVHIQQRSKALQREVSRVLWVIVWRIIANRMIIIFRSTLADRKIFVKISRNACRAFYASQAIYKISGNQSRTLLSVRLYELADVPLPRSSTYSSMLFYGAIIGTVIIIKSIERSRAEPRAFAWFVFSRTITSLVSYYPSNLSRGCSVIFLMSLIDDEFLDFALGWKRT